MEAEYIALAQSMQDLIPLQEMISEIYIKIFKKQFTPRYSDHSKAFIETVEQEYPIILLYL